MTPRQKLILFLISCDPGVKSIYQMVMIWDRADFPAKLSESLQLLLDNELIWISRHFENKTPDEYQITEKGEKYLEEHFDATEILNYISGLDNPGLLMKITSAYIDKKKKPDL